MLIFFISFLVTIRFAKYNIVSMEAKTKAFTDQVEPNKRDKDVILFVSRSKKAEPRTKKFRLDKDKISFLFLKKTAINTKAIESSIPIAFI